MSWVCETHPSLYGLGGTYLEGEAAKLRDRQNQAIDAATERVSHFYTGPELARVATIAAVDTYLRVMRENED